MTHHRIDGTIGDQFTLQEAPILVESEDEFFGVPGFGSLLPILAMLGASLNEYRRERNVN